MRFQTLLAACLALLATGASADVNDAAILAPKPPRLLSEFGFFEDMATMSATAALAPYDITSPLFTDHADKSRWIYAPGPAHYQTDSVLDFPVGSALIKTFHYGAQKVETRVLLHQEDGWTAYPYVWNDEGTEAKLKIAGKDLVIATQFGTINYRVPNFNQCKACHVDGAKDFRPIGPKVRNLNMGDQLARLVQHGVLDRTEPDAPVTPDYRDASLALDTRARAYLDANCGHCHAPGLPADTSGLYLNWEEDRAVHLGIDKPPVAAGRGSGGLHVDIAPGDPDGSILLYRMISEDPGVMMPEIGRSVIDTDGVDLIRAWIRSLD
ncbi:SO2930 family diheme c-type cytochrome [Falsiphaeobacter marinintestinus]|uniref:SO2930 family diheme c-type cytochrome n=1 Tax=Falsiphaeobacter marinintestinus TaxID=1492905 RepID=UPI0011B377DB|nr:SO2930 family diheme c-type cytochrome [Phaeobacter marinintestinus]